MFVSWKKYNDLQNAYDYLVENHRKQENEWAEVLKKICDEHSIVLEETCKLETELGKYKSLYADELQKRLELVKLVKGEKNEK